MKDLKKKKPKSDLGGMSVREKLEQRKKKIKESSSGGMEYFIIPADKTVRVRAVPVGEEREPAIEAVHFYLGQEIKGVISPATFGEPCKIMEAFNKLSKSKNDDDKKLAETFKPRKKYFMPVYRYKDEKGKEVDTQSGIKLLLLTPGLYASSIDLFLDEDDWGDFTDPKEGYDLKFTRSGSGLTDTEYSVKPCNKSRAERAFTKDITDPEELLRAITPSYEETESLLKQFLKLDEEDDIDEFLSGASGSKPVKKKKKIRK